MPACPPLAGPCTALLTAEMGLHSGAYAGTEDGDLSFAKDEVIKVYSTDGDWWGGETQVGARGDFPREAPCSYPGRLISVLRPHFVSRKLCAQDESA